MTVLQLISRSMRLLGALNTGKNPTAAEAADSLAALNAMVDAWATERLMMYTSSRTVFNITAGVQVYGIGPTGDWIAARPTRLEAAGILITGSPDAYERPLDLIQTDQDWARVRIKSLPSTLPTSVYFQPDYPNATLTFWPSPTVGQQVALYTPTAVTSFTSLAQTISLPPGYAKALAYNLAAEMAPEFGATISPVVAALATETKDSIKRQNLPSHMGRLRVDRALRARGGHWDYTIGEAR